jgi:NAD(P)-dependent dehydrogenase (short-subunit alcohol dehydrogenase family)
MQDFRDKLAVVSGGGSGIGRELVKQLSAQGCHVAMCDVSEEAMHQTLEQCRESLPEATRISTHLCDVSDESQVIAFCQQVHAEHGRDHINLLFNNAGIGGGGSFLKDDREEWDKTFGVCWNGVYFCSRAFVPLLVASSEGHIINISSVNGFWACMGPHFSHTAYSSAKFAVKGFSEALLVDLRLNAPHVKISLVMPGHIGTSIVINSSREHQHKNAAEMNASEVAEIRDTWAALDPAASSLEDAQVRDLFDARQYQFRDNAPTSAAQAAEVILSGVRNEQWRILVGEDAVTMDAMIREQPEAAYEQDFYQQLLAAGVFSQVPL